MCANLAKTPTNAPIIPMIRTYGQYSVKIVVVRLTVVFTIEVMIVANVEVALGIFFEVKN